MNESPLPLDSPRWSRLRHCYGPASDTPGLLRSAVANPRLLADGPASEALWSSLCHQGSVYEASFAALPHLVAIARSADPKSALFALAMIVAIGSADDIQCVPPADLMPAYTESLEHLPALAMHAFSAAHSVPEVAVCAGALLLARGHTSAAAHVFDPAGDGCYVCRSCCEELS